MGTGLAGCVGGQPDPPDDTPADDPDGVRTSFTVAATRCGTQIDRATVAFGDGTVTVEGTTWGSDACYTGRLESVTLDDGTLTVRVVAERPEDAGGCAQCISEIDYRATVEVPSTPARVVVIHRGETVATVTT